MKKSSRVVLLEKDLGRLSVSDLRDYAKRFYDTERKQWERLEKKGYNLSELGYEKVVRPSAKMGRNELLENIRENYGRTGLKEVEPEITEYDNPLAPSTPTYETALSSEAIRQRQEIFDDTFVSAVELLGSPEELKNLTKEEKKEFFSSLVGLSPAQEREAYEKVMTEEEIKNASKISLKLMKLFEKYPERFTGANVNSDFVNGFVAITSKLTSEISQMLRDGRIDDLLKEVLGE